MPAAFDDYTAIAKRLRILTRCEAIADPANSIDHPTSPGPAGNISPSAAPGESTDSEWRYCFWTSATVALFPSIESDNKRGLLVLFCKRVGGRPVRPHSLKLRPPRNSHEWVRYHDIRKRCIFEKYHGDGAR